MASGHRSHHWHMRATSVVADNCQPVNPSGGTLVFAASGKTENPFRACASAASSLGFDEAAPLAVRTGSGCANTSSAVCAPPNELLFATSAEAAGALAVSEGIEAAGSADASGQTPGADGGALSTAGTIRRSENASCTAVRSLARVSGGVHTTPFQWSRSSCSVSDTERPNLSRSFAATATAPSNRPLSGGCCSDSHILARSIAEPVSTDDSLSPPRPEFGIVTMVLNFHGPACSLLNTTTRKCRPKLLGGTFTASRDGIIGARLARWPLVVTPSPRLSSRQFRWKAIVNWCRLSPEAETSQL